MRSAHLVTIAIVVTLFGSAGCKRKAAWKLPIDPKQLPGTSTSIEAGQLEGEQETDPRLKQLYLSAELGANVCRKGTSNPKHQLDSIHTFGAVLAKNFFSADNLAKVHELMDCGNVLASNLDDNFVTEVRFNDDSGSKSNVDILKMKLTDLPPKYGLSKRAIGGKDGFCRTSDPLRPGVVLDCTPTSDAALRDGSTWYLGKRGDLDAISRGLATPKSELSTQLQALNDAASQVQGLSSLRIDAQLTSSKPFLAAPCAWASFESTGSASEFMTECFPDTDTKVITEIDGKVRAAAFEIEPKVIKADGIHGSVVLVARDDDGAKQIEKDAKDLVVDWKSQLENNEGKILKQAKSSTVSYKEKKWAIIADNFLKAIKEMQVSRDGHVVKLRFDSKLDPADKADLDAARTGSAARKNAIGDILAAIQAKQNIPVAALTVLVGPQWATYLSNLSTFDPKNVPASCHAPPPPAKRGAKVPPPPVDPKCFPPVEPPLSQFASK